MPDTESREWGWMRFIRGAGGPSEALIVDELGAAMEGDDQQRLEWGTRAFWVLYYSANTVRKEEAPTERMELIRLHFLNALEKYTIVASTWLEQNGRHDAACAETLGDANERYNTAVQLIDALPRTFII